MSVNRPFTPGRPEARERAWMNSVEERLDVLETQQRLFSSSIRGGAMVVYTDDLEQVGRIGVGTYSLPGNVKRTAPVTSLSEPDGTFHMLVDTSDGWVVPRWQYNWVEDGFIPVTSATYVNVWKTTVNILGLAFVSRFVVTADASTDGTIQVRMAGHLTDEVSISGGEQKTIDVSWDLTNKVNTGSWHVVQVRAKRDSGAGNINVYSPDNTYTVGLLSVPGATEGGIST